MARSVYKLTGQKKSSEVNLGYYAEGIQGGQRSPMTPMPYTRSLPRFHRIIETDENGRKIARQIAYAPSENTFYIDEFVNKDAKVVKPKFKKGFLIVDTDVDPLLPEYLAKLDCNASNENRNKKVPVKFIQLDKERDAKNKLDAEQKVATELLVFWDLPHERITAISNSVGIRTLNRPTAVWKHELFKWAEMNVDKFVAAYNNPEIEYVDTISRAENLGILKFDSFTWFYNSVSIMKVAQSKNRYTQLVAKLINDTPLERAISNEVNQKLGLSDRTISEQAESINFDEVDSKALLKMAKEHGVIKYKTGHGHYLVSTDRKIGTQSTDSAIEAIEEEHLLRDQIIGDLGNV